MDESYSNSSMSSSSSLSSQDTEDDQAISSILAEKKILQTGGKLGKRLSHLDSIPHAPRVNGEIPDVSYATLDHQRLAERLATYDLAEFAIEGDGNCQVWFQKMHDWTYFMLCVSFKSLFLYRILHQPLLFRSEAIPIPFIGYIPLLYQIYTRNEVLSNIWQFRALADQLFRNPDYHKHVRKQVKKQLRHHRKLYEAYVPMKYRSYVRKMKKYGEWGDHVTLQAAADRFGVKICLITSFRDTCYIEILPKRGNPTREVWLSYWCEVHYNSLYATADLPTRVPKKKYWLF